MLMQEKYAAAPTPIEIPKIPTKVKKMLMPSVMDSLRALSAMREKAAIVLAQYPRPRTATCTYVPSLRNRKKLSKEGIHAEDAAEAVHALETECHTGVVLILLIVCEEVDQNFQDV